METAFHNTTEKNSVVGNLKEGKRSVGIPEMLDLGLGRTKEGRKEGNVLFNDALNTFYLRLYGVRHMVKDHSDSRRKPAAAICATISD